MMATEIRHKLYGGAADLFDSKAPEIVLEGPAGTGKTFALLLFCHYMARNNPGCRILFIRKTRASMTESVLQIFEAKILHRGWLLNPDIQRSQRAVYNYANGSAIVCGGLDNVDRIMSTEYDIIALFEATEATENDWEKLLTRLRNNVLPAQQGICDCNPGAPGHWINQRANREAMARILSRHTDNPTLTPEYLDRLSHLTGHRRARLFLGQWAAAEGLIYDRWDEAIFVRPRKGKWKRAILPIDAGYSNPCTGALWLLDGDDYPHVYREWYKSGMIVADVLREAERFKMLARKRFGLELEAVVVDPSAAELIEELGRAGFPVHPADNEVLPGIQSMQERLTLNDMGAPRMTYDPECRDSIREIGSYHWQPNKDGQATDKPAKADDHAMDRDRYGSRYVDKTSGSMEVISL